LKIACGECEKSALDCEACVDNYKSKHWWNWLLIGIVSSLKWLIFGFNPVLASILAVKALLVMVLSQLNDDAVKEEFWRGVFIL
jgi:hypothetical protein